MTIKFRTLAAQFHIDNCKSITSVNFVNRT